MEKKTASEWLSSDEYDNKKELVRVDDVIKMIRRCNKNARDYKDFYTSIMNELASLRRR